MDELSQFKVAASEIVRGIGNVKNLLDALEKSVGDSKKQKEQYELAAETARGEYRKNIALAGDYKNEFEKTKKTEQDKIEQDKKETQKMLVEAGYKLEQAEKSLLNAQSKEKQADTKLAELAEKEKEIEQKRELARGFVQNFK